MIPFIIKGFYNNRTTTNYSRTISPPSKSTLTVAEESSSAASAAHVDSDDESDHGISSPKNAQVFGIILAIYMYAHIT